MGRADHGHPARQGAVSRLAAACLAAALGLAGCAKTLPPPEPLPPAPPPAILYRDVPPRVGLALGGGGARGFAQIGVLKVLEAERIPVALVAGTSVGSLIGALYADAGSARGLEALALSLEEDDLFDYGLLSVFSGGFIKGERVEAFLNRHLRARVIEQLTVPFSAVAVDLRTGEPVAFDRGSVARAVHASSAIPGVFVPVEINGRTFVDGGVANPVPADVVRRRGAEVVVAVAVPPAVPASAPLTPFEIAYHAVTIMSAHIGRLSASDADVVIRPEVGDIAYDDFSQKRRLIAAGEAAARKSLPALRAAIAAKTRRVAATP